MSSFGELRTPAPYIQMDPENIISLLLLVGLLTFFYFAFDRLIQRGGQKQDGNRFSYGDATTA